MSILLDNGNIELIHDDCLNQLKNISDNSVNLILTDPPYFKVKKNERWDNQWKDKNSFFCWLDAVFFELHRVLKPNGSFFIFCSSKLSASTEMLIAERFSVLNHIVWVKNSGPWNKMRKEDQRAFNHQTERIIFSEHYGAERVAKGSAGFHVKCASLRQQVFSPLIEYFKQAKDHLGISAKEINKSVGKQMCSHWFSYSQWQLPSEVDYIKLQNLFKQKSMNLNREYNELKEEYHSLRSEYGTLTKQYSELKEQYKSLRRPFRVTKDVPFTDVWTYKKVEFYPGKHPCEKPSSMLEDMIKATSNEGDLVLDCFMGSGSTGKACYKLHRRFIGIEFEEQRFIQTVSEFKTVIEQK